jgi:nitrate reductase (cytochrome), electron transfer subunit
VRANVRALQIGVAMVLALGVVGFFSGIAQTHRDSSQYVGRPLEPSEPHDVPVKPRSYADMRALRHGPNAEIYAAEFARITASPELFAEVPRSEGARRALLARRAERRAYDGAPPTIPHQIDQGAAPDCLVCHEGGARIAGLTAPRMSHPRYDSCTQCHVVSALPEPLRLAQPMVANGFQGLPGGGLGARAWAGAPPVIPHTTWMKSECHSCHGLLGATGLRSTHPWRHSCMQCHAPSAQLDQRVWAGSFGGAP